MESGLPLAFDSSIAALKLQVVAGESGSPQMPSPGETSCVSVDVLTVQVAAATNPGREKRANTNQKIGVNDMDILIMINSQSFDQQHLASLCDRPDLKTIEVDPGGDCATAVIGSVPFYSVLSGRQFAVYQSADLLAQEVVDG